jgi:hypothetical protein
MPVKTESLRDNRVLLLTYDDPLTAADVVIGFDAYKAVYAHATKPVHSISDVTLVTRMPSNLLSLVARPKDSPLRHPLAGLFIVVTQSSFILALVSAITRLVPRSKIRAVETIDLAWAEIEAVLAAEGNSVQSLKP